MPRMVSEELKKEEDAKGVFKMPPFYCSSKFVQQAVPRKKKKRKGRKSHFRVLKAEKERGILPFPFPPFEGIRRKKEALPCVGNISKSPTALCLSPVSVRWKLLPISTLE